MTAHTIKEEEHELHELRQDEWSDLGLAALAMGLALAASFLYPPFALPLLVGALASFVLAGRAFFRRLELSDRLLLDHNAYVIPEIRRRGEDLASMENRRALAQTVRTRLTPLAGYSSPARIAAAADELVALAAELDDERLSLDPNCAARCHHLLNDYAESPLLNDLRAEQEIHIWIRQIHNGLEPIVPSDDAPDHVSAPGTVTTSRSSRPVDPEA